MDATEKDLHSRKEEIAAAMELLFQSNMRITDWDVPEADDAKAAQMIVKIMQESLDAIKTDVLAGKYDTY